MRHLLWIALFFLTACSKLLPTDNPRVPETGTPESNIEIYRMGDPVTIHLEGTIYFCTDHQPTYSIVQIMEGGTRVLSLSHFCLGAAGTGIDQYCQDEQVKTVYVGECSDAIICEKRLIHGETTWNQKEFITITENCAGLVIHREAEQQVPPGMYQIILEVSQNERSVPKVMKEFLIVP